MQFKEAYEAVNACLTKYLEDKKVGGWTEKVRKFQTVSMPIISQCQDLPYLKQRVKELADELCSNLNWVSFGVIGGSTLKAELEALLLTIEKPPALDTSTVAAVPLYADTFSESPVFEKRVNTISTLESPPSTPPASATGTRPPISLPPSPVSVTEHFPLQRDPFAGAYRNLEAEQLEKNKRKNHFVEIQQDARPSEAEQNAILGMKYE